MPKLAAARRRATRVRNQADAAGISATWVRNVDIQTALARWGLTVAMCGGGCEHAFTAAPIQRKHNFSGAVCAAVTYHPTLAEGSKSESKVQKASDLAIHR